MQLLKSSKDKDVQHSIRSTKRNDNSLLKLSTRYSLYRGFDNGGREQLPLIFNYEPVFVIVYGAQESIPRKSMPPGYVAWRVGTTTRFLAP